MFFFLILPYSCALFFAYLQNPQSRTTLFLLCEDGSLRVYATNPSDSVQFWLKPQFQPVTPLAYLSLQSSKKCAAVKRQTPLKFPVDFFEHCQRMQNNEVDVSFICIYTCMCVCTCAYTCTLYVCTTVHWFEALKF